MGSCVRLNPGVRRPLRSYTRARKKTPLIAVPSRHGLTKDAEEAGRVCLMWRRLRDLAKRLLSPKG